MPYSALHAMMCCHTNESKPRFPSFRFSWPSEREFVLFGFASVSSTSLSPFRPLSFSQWSMFQVCANEYRFDWSEIRNDERMSRVAHKRKRKKPSESSANTAPFISLHISLLPTFWFGLPSTPRAGKPLFPQLCTKQKSVKSTPAPQKKKNKKTTVCLNDEK